MHKLEKIDIWYSIQQCGDGSASLLWFLTEEESEYDQEHMFEGWAEPCNGDVGTYVGSDIHKKAVTNSALQKEFRLEHPEVGDSEDEDDEDFIDYDW